MSKWSVTNGIFCGMILCDSAERMELEELGVRTEDEDFWLQCCLDLRDITLLRKRGLDGDEDALLTVCESLKHGVSTIFTVDAPIEDLEPHFIASRITLKHQY